MSDYGFLTVVCGPMFSGKSGELLKQVVWENSLNRHKVLLLKPSFDTRFGDDVVKTRIGLSLEARSIDAWPDIEDHTLLCLDEVQFFQAPYFKGDIIEHIKDSLRRGIDIFASGLDMDVHGNPFCVTASLLAMADRVIKKTSRCNVCGHPANKTYKRVSNGEVIQLGDSELYEARCNKHFPE